MTMHRNEYVTRTEFEENNFRIDRKFDELTEIMLKSFDRVYERFDLLESRFTGLEGRFGVLESRFDRLENRFTGLENRFDGLDNKFVGMQGDIKLIIDHLGIKSPVK